MLARIALPGADTMRMLQHMDAFDPRQTECFVAAANCGTLRAAAEFLALEPSTVSRNISALEARSGTVLLERGRNGVRVTEAGALLLQFLHQQSAALEVLRSDLDALGNMQRGNVVVAVGEGFVSDLMDRAIVAFNAQYPDITFSLTVGSTDRVVQLVVGEDAHIGLAYNVPRDPVLRVDRAAHQPLVVVVRKGGIYDIQTAYDPATLARLPCAIPPKSFGVGTMIASLEVAEGIRVRAKVETGSIAALKAFVRNDMGYTILPRFVVEAELARGEFAVHPLMTETMDGGTAAVIRKAGRKLPQAAQLLIRQLSKLAALS